MTAINEENMKLWKKEEYGFKEKDRFMKESQLHEVYESNGISLDDVLKETPDEEINLIKTKIEIITKNAELIKVIMNYTWNEKHDYSLAYSGAGIIMERLHPDFKYEDDYGNFETATEFVRTFYPKEKK